MLTFSPSCFPSYLVRLGPKLNRWRGKFFRWYGRLATRTVRKPRSPKWAPLLPKGIFVPDLPVFKRSKQNVRDVVINDGLHVHGIVVATRLGRITDPLDVHFAERLHEYLTSNLRHIDVEHITHMAKYVTSYGMKGLKRPMFSPDQILVLPKTLGELPDQKPWLGSPNSSREHFLDPLLSVVRPFPG